MKRLIFTVDIECPDNKDEDDVYRAILRALDESKELSDCHGTCDEMMNVAEFGKF